MITGATSGFGRATAQRLAKDGYAVIITGRREKRLEDLAGELRKEFNADVHMLAFDVRDQKAVKAAVNSLPNDWQKISVLINNAGLAVGKEPLQEGDTEDWDRMIDTNVKGLLYVSRAVIPLMKGQKSPHIINIGSTAGTEVYPGGNVYCASKHAVNALSKAMRLDLLPLGFKVTQIRPGLAETEFSMVRFKGDADKAEKVYSGLEPLHGEDIAEVIAYALSTPPHVCLNDIEITALAQANAYETYRK